MLKQVIIRTGMRSLNIPTQRAQSILPWKTKCATALYGGREVPTGLKGYLKNDYAINDYFIRVKKKQCYTHNKTWTLWCTEFELEHDESFYSNKNIGLAQVVVLCFACQAALGSWLDIFQFLTIPSCSWGSFPPQGFSPFPSSGTPEPDFLALTQVNVSQMFSLNMLDSVCF